MPLRFFLAGIMQGSNHEPILHDQDYRGRLRRLIAQHFHQAVIYDPLADHQNSLEYDETRGRDVFYFHNRLCREVDVVVAFVPSASMGTAIEMWEAHEHGRAVVVTISPLQHNWAVRYCSHVLFHDFPSFEQSLVSGRLARRIGEILQARSSRPQ